MSKIQEKKKKNYNHPLKNSCLDCSLLVNKRCTSSQCSREARHSLNSHFAGFHWAQCNISEELSRGRCCQVQTSSVDVRILLSQSIGIDDLEGFIESKLADSLEYQNFENCLFNLICKIRLPELNNQWQWEPSLEQALSYLPQQRIPGRT